jgi:hypothetical protein
LQSLTLQRGRALQNKHRCGIVGQITTEVIKKMRYAIAILAVIALILFGVLIFGGNGKKKTPTSPTVTPKTLPDYADSDAKVRYTIFGHVVGNDDHREIRITVSKEERLIEILQGYQGQVIKTQFYDNSLASYDVFLRAIALGGFTLQAKNPTQTDSRGVCPLGQQYFYELLDTGDPLTDQRTWSTSCGAKQGTFAGQASLIRRLFQNQFPPAEYNKFISGVTL